MGRSSTGMDREFGRPGYDPDDQGDYEEGLVFIIMPFQGAEFDQVYSAIRDACSLLDLRAIRADEGTGSAVVIREISELIERAEFIVADLTAARPNVYYELGYAHGVGNHSEEVLLVAKEGTELHFDIAPFRVQLYTSYDQLRVLVSENLKKMMRKTRK